MDCQGAQESILESLVEPFASERRMNMENHIATCETCRSFAEVQRTLDARLAAAVAAVRPSPGFRASLWKRIHRDPASVWPDFLPDVAHLVGCAFFIALSAFLLPLPSGGVVLAGLAFTGATYFLQTALRTSLDGLEGDS